MINVTKTFLPDMEEYISVLKRAWDKAWITNNGELLLELEEKLKQYLGVKHLLFTSNGTVVLQMALKALNVTKEVITTPFSYVATANAIIWENCTPRFVDINPTDFCINADLIEASINENTEAILATHVYGFPCDVEKIEKIAKKHNLKVIYDGAHAFGCTYNGRALLSYGDISTCSFHATKIFHTVEGGCIITPDDDLENKLRLYRQFGHVGDEHFSVGINGKNSEFHAAMGLCLLPKIDEIIEARKSVSELYDRHLDFSRLYKPKPSVSGQFEYSYPYYPLVFETEEIMLKTRQALADNDISFRRYFFPTLNTLPQVNHYDACPVSEDVSLRVVALPLYPGLEEGVVKKIAEIINKHIQ